MALKAVYQFCRQMDDIADGSLPTDRKKEWLIEWNQALKQFSYDSASPLDSQLQDAIRYYQLPLNAFTDMIEALLWDCDQQMYKPSLQQLETYCYGVASTVGLLAIHIFDCKTPQSQTFAIALGQALQRINILRDLVSDAQTGRIYLPMEWLKEVGLESITVDMVAAEPYLLKPLIRRMQLDIQERLKMASTSIHPKDKICLLPACCMASIYMMLLGKMKRDEFSYQQPYTLSSKDKSLAMYSGVLWAMRGKISARSIDALAP